MPYCKITQHTTDGSTADEGSWMRKLTRNIIDRKLCNVPRCQPWNEKELFTKTGTECKLNIVDKSASSIGTQLHWNVCRKVASEDAGPIFNADISSYADHPAGDLCSGKPNGAFCWVKNQDQCGAMLEEHAYCGYRIELTETSGKIIPVDIATCHMLCATNRHNKCTGFTWLNDTIPNCYLRDSTKPYTVVPKRRYVSWFKGNLFTFYMLETHAEKYSSCFYRSKGKCLIGLSIQTF